MTKKMNYRKGPNRGQRSRNSYRSVGKIFEDSTDDEMRDRIASAKRLRRLYRIKDSWARIQASKKGSYGSRSLIIGDTIRELLRQYDL